jgi:hypothetical protein
METPKWYIEGDWFDVCKCNVPCPCTFAEAPSYGDCEGVLAYHIRKGQYNDVPLTGLNLLAVSSFEGNIWRGDTKAIMGLFIDERADEQQRDALNVIWSGSGGGFPAAFAELIGEMRGIEYVPIEFEMGDNLAYWRAEIPGRVVAKAEALTGPMTPPGTRVQTLNAPGSEMGPGTVATWGRATANKVEAFGFVWEWSGRSSKHIPFNWSGSE